MDTRGKKTIRIMVRNYEALVSLLKFLFTHQDLDILQVCLPLVKDFFPHSQLHFSFSKSVIPGCCFSNGGAATELVNNWIKRFFVVLPSRNRRLTVTRSVFLRG